MRTRRTLLAGTLAVAMTALVGGWPSTAAAQDGGPANVQLQSFMAPIQKAGGKTGSAALTIILEVPDTKNVNQICWMSPRILDAVMQLLYERPIAATGDGALDLSGLEARLTKATNAALRKNWVSTVVIVEGMKGGGGGGAKFAKSQRCRDVSK